MFSNKERRCQSLKKNQVNCRTQGENDKIAQRVREIEARRGANLKKSKEEREVEDVPFIHLSPKL